MIFTSCSESIKTNYDFYIACANNNVKSVKTYLRKHPQSANAELTSLEYRQFARYLIDNEKTVSDAPVSSDDKSEWVNTYKSYPIIIASERGYIEIVKLLINANAYLDAGNNEQYTALMNAVYENHFDVVKLLVSAGADVNAKNEHNMTALNLAIVSKGSLEIVRYLIYECGAKANHYKYDNSSPLHHVQDVEVAKKLLSMPLYKKEINWQNNYGTTPLMSEIYWGNYDIVKIFIEEGADIHILNKAGESALDIAIEEQSSRWASKEEKEKLEELIYILEFNN